MQPPNSCRPETLKEDPHGPPTDTFTASDTFEVVPTSEIPEPIETDVPTPPLMRMDAKIPDAPTETNPLIANDLSAADLQFEGRIWL